MGLGKFVEGVKRRFSFRKRKPPKTASGLPAVAGELPEDPRRRALCLKAFEEGLERLASFEDLAPNMAARQDADLIGVLWPALAPLTREERWAVAWRVREFAIARKNTRQNS